MRLFRQQTRGDWAGVIERVKQALETQVEAGPPPAVVTPSTPLPRPNPRQGAAPGVRPGFFGAAETRVGILQYRPADDAVGRSLDWYGEYLQPQLDLLAKMVRPGSTVLEVGAGIGAHAVMLAELVGPQGHVLVCEPRPVEQRVVGQNLQANKAVQVTLLQGMLGQWRSGAPAPATTTVDELQLEQLQLLKIGEEVAGSAVLAGADATLWRLRPLLFVAAADAKELEQLTTQVREYSYRCWKMDVALFNPANFNRREDDIFAGRVALALLAIPEEIDVDIDLEHCSEIR